MGILYSRLKVFHHTDHLYALPLEQNNILSPISLRIKPTNICNHNCRYCAYRSDALQLGKDMVVSDSIPKEKMFEIIDDAAEMGVQAITFSGGGEPFCYPHFEETLHKLSDTEIQFSALTNGSRLNGKAAHIFSERGTWIRISIDGWDASSYAAYRGISDSAFQKVISGIEAFAKTKRNCYLGTAIVVDEKNCNHIFELAKLLKESGADSVKISPVITSNLGQETNAYHRKFEPRVREEIDRVTADLKGHGFEVFDSYHLQLETFEKSYEWCPYIQLCPVIGANSMLYSCHDKAYNNDTGLIGDLTTSRFREVWGSQKERFFSINPKRDCGHHCVVNNANEMIHEFLDIDARHKMFV